jgi:hypothetical protein
MCNDNLGIVGKFCSFALFLKSSCVPCIPSLRSAYFAEIEEKNVHAISSMPGRCKESAPGRTKTCLWLSRRTVGLFLLGRNGRKNSEPEGVSRTPHWQIPGRRGRPCVLGSSRGARPLMEADQCHGGNSHRRHGRGARRAATCCGTAWHFVPAR